MRKVLFSALLCAASSIGICQLRLQPFVSGLTHPVAMVQDPSQANVQYVVQFGGTIRVIKDGALLGTPLLDITDVVLPLGEGGLLSLALPPDYATSGYAYVFFHHLDGNDRIWRFKRSAANLLLLDRASDYPILTIPRAADIHHGGTMHFGPDGYLYAGIGDGSRATNPQDPNTLLGKMIRIDPTADDFPDDPMRNYHIPASNPFVDGHRIQAMGEIWDFGIRNPWKWTFDSLGDGASDVLIIADVGAGSYEEIDEELPNSGGVNYGWPIREGRHYLDRGVNPAFLPLTDPANEYAHWWGGGSCAITGGYIYRGSELGRNWKGMYFFGDSESRRIWTCWLHTSDIWPGDDHTDELDLGHLGLYPTSIDIDSKGELYFSSYSGTTIYKLVSSAVAATGLTIYNGHAASGGLGQIAESDDQRLVVDSQEPSTAEGQPVDIRLEATAPAQTATALRFFIEAQGSGSGLHQSVDLWDFSAGQWIQLDSRPAIPTDERAMLTATNPNRFIESGTRLMRARIRYWRDNHDRTPFAARIDQAVWGFYP